MASLSLLGTAQPIISPILSTDTEETCQFNPRQLQANCTINLNQKNQDFESSEVEGVVTLNGQNICNESKKIFVYNG